MSRSPLNTFLFSRDNNTMKILLSQFWEQHPLSIRQAAIMTGVPRSTIGDIVTGRVSPTLATMEQLAAGLKTTISGLYESEYK